ncbi:hypothetical protein DPMN_003989 [Dreissena polymorpha]|uniref:Uncharacterized protein n=1 Tax=Dreissena polymorpha TaxID=45954 RepID=A0A9D4MRT1_DREPO|nr:hypothetical protein DPMN_003989 [Dreissena polymorpha]
MALSGRNGMTVLKLVMVLQRGLDTVGMALQMSLFQRKKIVLVTYAQWMERGLIGANGVLVLQP